MTGIWKSFSEAHPKRMLILFACGAILGILIAGYSLFTAEGTTTQAIPPENVALVNQRHILRSDFIAQIELETTLPFRETTEAQRRKVLNDMIHEELLVQRGLEIDLAASDPDVRAAMVAGVNMQVDADVLSWQPKEEELRAYYETHKQRYSSEGMMQVKDLVTAADTAVQGEAAGRAREAVAALRRGVPVERVMAEFKFNDSGRADEGDMFDFAARIKLGDKVFAAAAPLKDGEVSDPVYDGTDFHIVVMQKRSPPVAREYVQARDAVWQDIKKDAKARVEAANLKFLEERATILVAPGFSR